MHDVAVALDLHEARHPDAARARHPAEVVAPQIHQHDVLGALLGIGQQLLGQPPVLGGVGAARPGAGDRPRPDVLARHPHQHLGRGADQRRLGALEQHHVGARVDHPQRPVERQRRHLRALPPAPRQHHLEDVAGGDPLLGPLDRRPVVGAADQRLGAAGRGAGGPGPAQGDRAAVVGALEQRRQLVQLGLGLAPVDLALDLVGHRQQPLAGMVEDHHAVEPRQLRQRQTERIGRPRRQPLEQPHQVVAEVADEAAGERQRAARRLDRPHELRQGRERRAGQRPPAGGVLLLQPVGVEPVDRARRRAQEAVARHLLAAGDALEQEPPGRQLGQPPVDAERRQGVGEELPRVWRRPHRAHPLSAGGSRPSSAAAAASCIGSPVMSSNCGAAWCSRTSRPSTAVSPRARACWTRRVGRPRR